MGAENGTLILMAGGEVQHIERFKPIAEHLGQKLTHMGEVGTGQITKICNQMIVASNALIVTGLQGCIADSCDNDVSQSVRSPSGGHDAVVFYRDCGATTGFSTQLSIIRAGSRLPSAPGNTLVLDDTIEVALTWTDESELVVAYSAPSTPFKREKLVSGVRVRYVPQAL